MSDIRKEFKGNVGLFLVCAELSKKNLIAMPTSRNTKGYDVIVLNPKTNKSVGLQVKCTDRKEFPIMSTYWRDYEQKIEEKILSDFVFVDISHPEKANYFILSKREVKDVLKSSIEKYLHRYQQKRNLTLQQLFEKEIAEKKKRNLWVIGLNAIEEFKDKWETITNPLKN